MSSSHKCTGRLFQRRGPAAAKLLWGYVLQCFLELRKLREFRLIALLSSYNNYNVAEKHWIIMLMGLCHGLYHGTVSQLFVLPQGSLDCYLCAGIFYIGIYLLLWNTRPAPEPRRLNVLERILLCGCRLFGRMFGRAYRD